MTGSKAVAGRPSKVVDCGTGQARLQLEGKAVAGKPREVVDCRLGADNPGGTTGEQDRPRNLVFQSGEIKPQTSE